MNNLGDRIEGTTNYKQMLIFRFIEAEKIKFNQTDGGVDFNISDFPSPLISKITEILDAPELPETKMSDLVCQPRPEVLSVEKDKSSTDTTSFVLAKEKLEYNAVQQRLRKKLRELGSHHTKKQTEKDYGEMEEEEAAEESEDLAEDDIVPPEEDDHLEECNFPDEETSIEEDPSEDIQDISEALDDMTLGEDNIVEFDFKGTNLITRVGFYTKVLSKQHFAF